MKKYSLGVCAMLLAFMLGPPGKLWAGTISMQLVGVSQSLGSYYVAPYQTSVGGTTYNLICDDALDNVSIGEKWSAATETLSNLSGVLFSQGYLNNNPNTPVPTQTQAYQEAGWLVQQILANISNTTVAGEYQYALWDLFDPGFSNTTGTLADGEPGADLADLPNGATVLAAVNSDLSDAESDYGSCTKCSGMVIYTPSPKGTGEPQEYFGYETPQAPEPMTLWSLLLALAAIALACKWVDKTAVKSSVSASV